MTQKRPSKRLGAFCAALLLSTALTATAQAALPSVTVDGAAVELKAGCYTGKIVLTVE